jgi:hypothetical protein
VRWTHRTNGRRLRFGTTLSTNLMLDGS